MAYKNLIIFNKLMNFFVKRIKNNLKGNTCDTTKKKIEQTNIKKL